MKQVHSFFMNLALKEAEKAHAVGLVPVGAVLVFRNHVIASGYNDKNLVIHAEMKLLQKNNCCHDCDLYVTMEPCTMCAAAISLARVSRVIFGAYNPKRGGIIHGVRFFEQKTCHHKPEVISGILEEQCGFLLKKFFLDRR